MVIYIIYIHKWLSRAFTDLIVYLKNQYFELKLIIISSTVQWSKQRRCSYVHVAVVNTKYNALYDTVRCRL